MDRRIRPFVAIALAAAAVAFQQAGWLRAAVFNVQDYGAQGNAQVVHDAAIEAGSRRLTSGQARFTSADLGRQVYVVGTGPKSGPLASSIVAVAAAQTVELADAAAGTVREASLTIGADDTAAVARALAAATAAGGGTVYFPAGTYRTTKNLEIAASNIHLQGEGDRSIIFNSRMQFYADNHEKHLQGGWTGDRVLFVGTPKYAISNIEIDNLQITNNGDQWVHATIGQPIVMTGATADYATANFHLHHVTLTTKSFNGYSNGGVLDRFSIDHLRIPETAKEALYLAGRCSNGTVSDNQIATTINPAISNIGIAGKGLRNVKIVRNTITGKFWCAIVVTHPHGLRPGQVFCEEDVCIEDNFCSFTAHPHAADGIAVDYGTRITVARNVVENAGAFGITFRGPESDLGDVAIQENTVRNMPRGYAISVVGGRNPARGPHGVLIAGNQLTNNANGIEAWNVTGKSRIVENLIHADRQAAGVAFHVQPADDATVACSANKVHNYRSGIQREAAVPK